MNAAAFIIFYWLMALFYWLLLSGLWQLQRSVLIILFIFFSLLADAFIHYLVAMAWLPL